MMNDELKLRERRYRAQWRAYAIIKRMRWLTLVLGPFPIIWDNIIAPALAQFGLPDIVTMEDVAQAIVFGTGWISQETFETYWPHLNNVCTLLFLIFLLWTIQKKRAAKSAAREVVELEDRMSVGGLGGVL
ncbi:MAG: hypothetical protein CMB52_05045 [Euryarchaeota archaeon]|nr:hypothetical protein [Euryarchaeota archaeon]|tara:strand:- start:1931 stop:2323 length:393 start_codon:yes stop_codon:yes gene_type:complete